MKLTARPRASFTANLPHSAKGTQMADFPNIDFSGIGDLANVYNAARQRATREQVLSNLGQGGGPLDYGAASKALLAAGDTQGGLSLANLAQAASRDTRDFGFREQEANRAQSNADRAYAFQKQQADEAAKGFDLREVDDGNGGKQLVRTNKATGETFKVDISGAQSTPSNPYAYGKQNEAQSKDSGFANRMFRAEGVLRDPAVEGAALDAWENTKAGVANKTAGPVSWFANSRLSADFQKFDQAKRDFVNAVLRRESGAAISQSEFDNANKQYFGQPGDTPERIAEKRRNRQDAIAGVAGGGGQSYKPPFTFSPTGEMMPTGNPGQGAAGAGQAPKPQAYAWRTQANVMAARANPQQTINDARASIEKGMPPQEAARRLAEVGIDPKMLTAQPGFASPEQRQ